MAPAVAAAAVLAGLSLVADAVRATEPDARITVLGEVSVDRELIRLVDIARLEGAPAQALAEVEIGQAPAPGGTRVLAGQAILGTLRGRGVDLGHVRYVIPPTVRVHRRAQEVSASTVRAIVEEYVRTRLGPDERGFVLRNVDVPARVRLPPGPYSARVIATRGAPIAGKTRLLVEFLQDDRIVTTIGVTADIAMFEDVHITRRAIPRGGVVTAEDLLVERRDVSTLPRGVIVRAEDAVGKEAKVALAPFTALRHQQLGAPALVRRGDVVTLLVECAGLRITTKGEVREDAPRGAQVRVLNRRSRREVVGRVMDATTIGVPF
jgi:flagella basal body P-ring formation protein FlgA